MKHTPQELMDLPYAGMAEKQLRKQGDWAKTPDEVAEDASGIVEDLKLDIAHIAPKGTPWS